MIRLWLGVLIAANAVLFLWMQYGDSSMKNAPQQPLSKPDFGEIRLAQEADVTAPPLPQAPLVAEETVAEQEQEQELQPPPAQESPTTYCGELGPIRSRNMAESYRRALSRQNTATAQVEERPGKEDVGYWVMIPALPDVASAESMLKKLQAAGLEDLWLMRKGDHKNAISLGLYTDKRHARRHADNINQEGFSPVVKPKQRNVRVYWVVYSDVEEEALQVLEEQKLPTSAALAKKVCKQALIGN